MKNRKVWLLLFCIFILNFNFLLLENNFSHTNRKLERLINKEKHMRTSQYWNLTGSPIYIDNAAPYDSGSMTWAIAVSQPWCKGSGSWSDPYIIENVIIDGQSSDRCIYIRDSDKYFRIENCTLYNSGLDIVSGGIILFWIRNGQIINNTCSYNNANGMRCVDVINSTFLGNNVNNNKDNGIYLLDVNNNTISGNMANNNSKHGLNLFHCDNNTVSGNIANNNKDDDGIYLISSNNNIISENIVNNNKYDGVHFRFSNNNTVTGNTVTNNRDDGVYFLDSNNNIISANNVSFNKGKGFHLYNCNNSIISENEINYNRLGILLNCSNYNTISENTIIGNHEGCIEETNCEGNVFENNYCEEPEVSIPGYDLIFLFWIISVVSIILIKRRYKYYQ